MRALSATTNVVVGGTSTISSSFLSFARSAAEAATLSTGCRGRRRCLAGGAQFVADFGEEGAAGESGFVDGVEVGSLLFDSSNVVNSPNQGREKERKAQRHEQECKGEVGFMSPECAQR